MLTHPKTTYSSPGSQTEDEHGTPTLFNANYTPPEVSGMYSSNAKPIDIATTLGTVGMDSLKKFGRLPESSDDLSADSTKVVNKVHSKIGRDRHEAAPNNIDQDFADYKLRSINNLMGETRHTHDYEINATEDNYSGMSYSKLSKEDVAQGSNLVRSMFKRPKLSKQFDQLELPQ